MLSLAFVIVPSMQNKKYSGKEDEVDNMPANSTIDPAERSKIYEDDELNLLDVLRFIWKWRTIILSSSIVGSLLGYGSIYYRIKTQKASTNNLIWTAVYSLESNGDKENLLGAPAILDQFLKTNAGARIFVGALNKQLDSPRINADVWSAKQEGGSGLLSSIEVINQTLVVEFNPSGQVNETEIKNLLGKSINLTIDEFNARYGRPSEQLRIEEFNIQIEIAKLKNRIIAEAYGQEEPKKDYESKFLNTPSAEGKNSIKSDQFFAMLLSKLSEDSPKKDDLIKRYVNLVVYIESLQTRYRNLLRASGVDTLFPLSKVQNLLGITSREGPTKVSDSRPLLSKPWLGLIMGGLAGFTIGILVVTIFSLLKKQLRRMRGNN